MHIRPTLVVAALVLLASPAVADELSGTLKKIRDSGAITLGHRIDAVPFSYQDDQGQIHGYSIDLCQRVVETIKSRLGLGTLRIDDVEVTAANRIRLVRNGTVDLECGTTTHTAGREQEVAFSVTTFVVSTRFLSKRRMGIQDYEDLKGLTVASLSGTTNIREVVELNSDKGLEMVILPAPNPTDAMRMLESNHIAAFFWDDILLAAAAATATNPRQYVLSDQALSVEPYALMLRRDDPAFKDAVDDALVRLFRSDEIKGIYERWFMSPIPGSGINLQFSLSPSLQRIYNSPTDASDPLAYER